MRLSQFPLSTVKETPADAELISHQLMIRAGLIRKISTGIYAWLPLGLRVLQKVSQIVREEMNRVGALEVMLPSVQPAELWQESTRWDQYGPELLRFKDRHDRDFCYGPTHEEVITEIFRRDVKSYKQLPLNLYQIQTKFRDEIRPRFGVMRAREFLMKDAYSYHLDQASLKKTYEEMYNAYSQIFKRIGVRYRAVLADTGSIGGNVSHEFQVLADSGEDKIFYSDSSDYAANLELAEAVPEVIERPKPGSAMETVDTPDIRTISALSDFLKTKTKQSVKTLIVKGSENNFVALILRGDHELNEIKAQKHPLVANPFVFATDAEIKTVTGVMPGSIGPVNLPLPIIVDRSAAMLADFICGANQEGKHYINVNWGRDLPVPEIADLRNVVEGDVSPDRKGKLKSCRGIEVGHIFQLGDKYTKAMSVTVLGETGKPIVPVMGCYGIGVSRVVAAAIEQNNDEHGIIWPEAISPFQVALLPINMHKSSQVKEVAESIYQQFLNANINVLLDDRDLRPGMMFAECDLIGIPHRIVIGEKNLANQQVEYKARSSADTTLINIQATSSNIEMSIEDLIEKWRNKH